MEFLSSLSLLLLAVIASFSQAKDVGFRNFDGYQVYSVSVKDHKQLGVLRNIFLNNEEGELDFWTEPKLMREADVMVPPEQQNSFKSLLVDNGMRFEVKVADVQRLIAEEMLENKEKLRLHSGREARKIGFNYFARYNDIQSFLLHEVNPTNIATVEVIGQTYEGRDIHSVKISNSPYNRKSILIDANIHAREWITSASALYIISEFVRNTSQYAATHLDGIDWYIIPLLNADGYEYTHTNDRTWRKTRSVNSGSQCRGCDPNRNFPYYFGGEGTSSNPCSEIFKGHNPLSEKETKALANYITYLQVNRKNATLAAYISFHSYGQLWLLPWGYTEEAYPEDYEQQEYLGERAKEAISKAGYGTEYEVGTGANILYGVGGASDDYAKSVGIKYTVTVEMRDKGHYGFIIPPNQIEANAKEIMAALGQVAEQIRLEE